MLTEVLQPFAAGVAQSPAEPGRPDANSIHGLSLGKSPGAMQNLGAGPIEAHRINPALRDRQTIGSCTIAAAKLDGHRAVFALLRGDVVNGIGVKLVRLEVALGVVDGDLPEGIYRHVLNLYL